MITPLTLQDGLNRFLKSEISYKTKLKTINESGDITFKSPQVISGWLLPKTINDGIGTVSEFPYIATRIMKVENIKNSTESIVTIKILFGVFCSGVYAIDEMPVEDASGYRDIWNLIETTRQKLFEKLVIDKKYMIVSDYFEAVMLDEQPYPFWEGYCITKWHIAYPFPMMC